jgi:hypothetical protein
VPPRFLPLAFGSDHGSGQRHGTSGEKKLRGICRAPNGGSGPVGLDLVSSRDLWTLVRLRAEADLRQGCRMRQVAPDLWAGALRARARRSRATMSRDMQDPDPGAGGRTTARQARWGPASLSLELLFLLPFLPGVRRVRDRLSSAALPRWSTQRPARRAGRERAALRAAATEDMFPSLLAGATGGFGADCEAAPRRNGQSVGSRVNPVVPDSSATPRLLFPLLPLPLGERTEVRGVCRRQ